MYDDPGADAPHPLAAMLGDNWRWFDGGSAQATVLLHTTGLFTTVSLTFLATAPEPVLRVVAVALYAALLEGRTGEVIVQMERPADGPPTACCIMSPGALAADVERNERARATYPVLDREHGGETFVDAEGGKYTFRVRGGEVYIDRHGAPWVKVATAGKALIALIHEAAEQRTAAPYPPGIETRVLAVIDALLVDSGDVSERIEARMVADILRKRHAT